MFLQLHRVTQSANSPSTTLVPVALNVGEAGMSQYQFDGVFRDSSWGGELPSNDEVKVSVERAIRGATPQVFKVEVSRIDISALGDELPATISQGWPWADVIVDWEVTDDGTVR